MTNGAAWGVLLLRIALGVILVMHGYAAVMTFTPRGVAALVTRIGFPAWTAMALAWYLIVVHAVGGALIVLGLWTRLAAVLNVPVMLAAVVLLHWPQGFFMRAVVSEGRPTVVGYEFALLVLACTLAVALIGAGPLSFDGRRPGRRR
jgi:putative oxidoreductase